MVKILSMLCKSNRIVACIACCFASQIISRVAASIHILMLEVVIVQGKLPNPIPFFVPWVTDPSLYMMSSYELEYFLIYAFTSESALPAAQSWHSLLSPMCVLVRRDISWVSTQSAPRIIS